MNKEELQASAFETDQEIRWCPGCGDFAILKQVHSMLPKIGILPENIVFISGIGCSSRFPYYTNTYGFHSIHGRATAIATGLKTSRPDLSVWVVTGDGDGLSIGANHLLHLLRRNVDVNILLFNNRIYGLTKGQYSPTSELNKVTASSPAGTADYPLNTLAFALSSGATFVARSFDKEPRHLQEVLVQSHQHRGSSFLEIYQNCHIYNDGAFDHLTARKVRNEHLVFLEEGKPLRFGPENEKTIAITQGTPEVKNINECSGNELFIHESGNKFKASLIAQMDGEAGFPSFAGILYQASRGTFDELVQNQISQKPYKSIQEILNGKDCWTIN